MKILLVYPGFLEQRRDDADVSAMPMGLYYMGALLQENGYAVQLLNLYEPGRPADRIDAYLRKIQPDLLGFSIVHANRWGGIEMAERAKTIAPEVITVFGGVGAAFLWEYLLSRFPQIDYVITGEGEYSLLELVCCLAANEPSRIAGIPGLARREDGRPLLAAPAVRIDDLDGLPNPARCFSYQHLALSRGCPENCVFCGSPRFWERQVRFHSPEYFVEQMTLLYARGVAFFYVSDDNFIVEKERAIAVCRQIIKRKLPVTWAAISRVDRVDEEILYWMRRAGCIQISYGVESGADTIRRRLNKRITREQIKRAFDLTIRYGIMARAYFIYGCPGETKSTIQASVDLMQEIKPLGMVSYVLDIFPGTALYADYLRRQNQTDAIWDERVEDILYFETDPELTAADVQAFGRTLRKAFYRHLPGFTENLQLLDAPELYPAHADFYSRLALTFSHGDYAGHPDIPEALPLAGRLYKQALDWHPDERAYLGLGMIYQQQAAWEQSRKILQAGLRHFPHSESLHTCLGVTWMNMSQVDRAVDCFRRFPRSRQALEFLARCYEIQGERGRAEETRQKIALLS